MKAALAAGLVALVAVAPGVSQEEGPPSLLDWDSFRKGSALLEAGRWRDAASHLSGTWAETGAADSGGPVARILASRLLDAWLGAEDHDAILAWFEEHGSVPLGVRHRVAVAGILREAERFPEAARLYASLPGAREGALAQHLAFCLAAGGNPAEALEVLERDYPAERVREKYLRGRLALEANQPGRALTYLEDWKADAAGADTGVGAVTGDPEGDGYGVEARLLVARCHSALGEPEKASAALIALIEDLDDPVMIYRAFEELAHVADRAEQTRLTARLAEWRARSESPDLRLAAEFYGGLLDQGDEGELEAHLERFARENPDHPLGREALLTLSQINPEKSAQWLSQIGEGESGVFPDARIAYARATGLFANEDFDEAVRSFTGMAEGPVGDESGAPLYNAAVAALYGDDEDAFETLRQKIVSEYADSPVHADLLFLSGIFFAQKSDPRAFDLLTAFAQDYPAHPSAVEARLALAELHLNQVPARPQAAREILAALRAETLTIQQAERLDYTALWTEVIDPESVGLEEMAERFLANWPSSIYRAEVSLLIATESYRDRDFPEAERMFRLVAEEMPESEYVETALFFAARCAPPSEEILARWEEVICADGPLALSARHEKGLTLVALQRYAEARETFEELVEREPDPARRIAAMSEIGFAYYMEALDKDNDSALLERAAEAFGRVARQRDAGRGWRYEVSVRRAKCLEALGKSDVALEIYRSIIRESDDVSLALTPGTPLRETEWLYRAGFAAIELLEANRDWAGAIRLADSLSRKNGPRAIEASRYAERMRLEHWVWE